MSLLLDALRRAEEDSRKRKSDTESVAPAKISLAEKVGAPELTLQEQTSPTSPTPAPTAVDTSGLTGADPVSSTRPPVHATGFPDLAPTRDGIPAAVSAPEAAPMPAAADSRAPVQPYGRYARPVGAEAGQQNAEPAKGGWAVAQAAREPVRPTAEAMADGSQDARLAETASAKPPVARIDVAAPLSATTQRQALSAAGAMAGARVRPAMGKVQRRQWVLVALVLLVALPLVGFLLFGDALFGSSSTLAVRSPAIVVTVPDSPAASPADVPAADKPVSGAVETSAAPVGASNAPVAAQATASAVLPTAATQAAASGVAGAADRPRMVATAPVRRTERRQQQDTPANRDVAGTTAKDLQGVSLLSSKAKPASQMESAYAAYQAGKLGEATRLYQEVLRADPTQRDAWLGLAVIAHASNQREPAMDAYKRVLRLEPQNATALAGLSSLITNAGEPQQESRLREMLARTPQEADLNNALGLVLSGERRWSEAQPLFFKAHSAAPQEPQFAYNLAVTLDHLRKASLAAQYYETALGLAQGKVSGFDEASARSRLAALKAGASAGTAR
ncbi:tetratricopeptide repeat protein [Polaromonas sp.]|uniref:tetratricopeptide repeat protein n=1 Tax=Polaromonas sp. TaxID=1869339 RepID=UPI003CA48936